MRIIYVEKLSPRTRTYILNAIRHTSMRCSNVHLDWTNSRKYKQVLIETLIVSRWNSRELRFCWSCFALMNLKIVRTAVNDDRENQFNRLEYTILIKCLQRKWCKISNWHEPYHFNDKICDLVTSNERIIYIAINCTIATPYGIHFPLQIYGVLFVFLLAIFSAIQIAKIQKNRNINNAWHGFKFNLTFDVFDRMYRKFYHSSNTQSKQKVKLYLYFCSSWNGVSILKLRRKTFS